MMAAGMHLLHVSPGTRTAVRCEPPQAACCWSLLHGLVFRMHTMVLRQGSEDCVAFRASQGRCRRQ